MHKIEVIGHRGARSYFPENTIPAYDFAIKSGVDMIDLDVVATKDKVLICYHDLIINPDILCDISGNYLAKSKKEFIKHLLITNTIDNYLIKNLTLQELQNSYRVKLNSNSPYASYFPKQKDIPGIKISSLQDIVDYVNHMTSSTMPLQVEIKNNLDNYDYSYSFSELAVLLYDFILKNNLIERIKIQAFDWRILLELNKLEPKIKTAYLVDYTFKSNWQRWFANSNIIIKAYEFIKNKGQQLNIYNLDDFNVNDKILYLIKYLGAYSYEPEDNELTKNQVDLSHDLSIKVYVWTWPEHSGFVTRIEVIQRLSNWGIDGFITDDPIMVKNLLD